MEEPLVNRVQESGLIQLDLAALLSPEPTAEVDLAQWLANGGILREKPFRDGVTAWDASSLHGHVIALTCSLDAILPDWAWMLVTAKLSALGAPVDRIRVDSIIDASQLSNGHIAWLQKGWPELFDRLAMALPRLREWV